MTEQQTTQHPGTQHDPGAQQPGTQPPQDQRQSPYPPYRRLTRTSWDAPVSGVCGGIARYLDVDATLVRVLATLAIVFTFPAGLIAYAVAWAVMPKE
jgi:phage shock protein PspC (stress-responsive transcriptional regulator)